MVRRKIRNFWALEFLFSGVRRFRSSSVFHSNDTWMETTHLNKKKFYDKIRKTLGPLTTANVLGFENILDEAEKRGILKNHLAYILATAWWESGKTMQPVREAFWLSEDWRKKNLRYYPYYGRGLVQITWESNYKKAGEILSIDLVNNPELALDQKVATKILFEGMEHGWFTQKDLEDYIDDKDEPDNEDYKEYLNARKIINGMDRAKEIADLALMFEKAIDEGTT